MALFYTQSQFRPVTPTPPKASVSPKNTTAQRLSKSISGQQESPRLSTSSSADCLHDKFQVSQLRRSKSLQHIPLSESPMPDIYHYIKKSELRRGKDYVLETRNPSPSPSDHAAFAYAATPAIKSPPITSPYTIGIRLSGDQLLFGRSTIHLASQIGEGTSANVVDGVIEDLDGRVGHVAVKFFRKSNDTPPLESAAIEYRNYERFKGNPRFVQCLGFGEFTRVDSPSKSKVATVLEFAGQPLSQQIKKQGISQAAPSNISWAPTVRLNKVDATTISTITQLLEAGKDMAESRVIHGDIKPANILIDSKNKIKIADLMPMREMDENGVVSGTCEATPYNMSPEAAVGLDQTEKSDVFSMGTVIYELLTGIPFSRGTSLWGILGSLFGDKTPEFDLLEGVEGMTPRLKQLIQDMLAVGPESEGEHRIANGVAQRPTFEQALTRFQAITQPTVFDLIPTDFNPPGIINGTRISDEVILLDGKGTSMVVAQPTRRGSSVRQGIMGPYDNERNYPADSSATVVIKEIKVTGTTFKEKQSSTAAGLRAVTHTHQMLSEIGDSNYIVKPKAFGYYESLDNTKIVPFIAFEHIRSTPMEAPTTPQCKVADLKCLGEMLAALSKGGVCHRNITFDNILRHKDTGQLTLVDFDGAIPIPHSDRREKIHFSIAPTPVDPKHMAPEGWNGKYCDLSEVYTVGAMMYQMVTGKEYHANYDPNVHRRNLRQKTYEKAAKTEMDKLDVPLKLTEFILSMVSFDPKDRPTGAETQAFMNTLRLQD